MKKRFFRIVIFISIIVTADVVIGEICKELYLNSNNLAIAKIRYTFDSSNQDILIYGSSRAEHHYVPDILTQQTGMSCYNCGIGGQGLAFSFIQIEEMLKRQKPKLIILDISPNILTDSKSDEKLNVLKPYFYRDTIIQHALTGVSEFEKLKYFSTVYPYNGSIISILTSFIYFKKDMYKGYLPLDGKLIPSSVKILNVVTQLKVPDRQIYYLNRIIKICKSTNVELKLVVSPIYLKNNTDDYILEQIRRIAASNKVDFIDFSTDAKFFKDAPFFKDNLHLNSEGATEFSNKLAAEIGQVISSGNTMARL